MSYKDSIQNTKKINLEIFNFKEQKSKKRGFLSHYLNHMNLKYSNMIYYIFNSYIKQDSQQASHEKYLNLGYHLNTAFCFLLLIYFTIHSYFNNATPTFDNRIVFYSSMITGFLLFSFSKKKIMTDLEFYLNILLKEIEYEEDFYDVDILSDKQLELDNELAVKLNEYKIIFQVQNKTIIIPKQTLNTNLKKINLLDFMNFHELSYVMKMKENEPKE